MYSLDTSSKIAQYLSLILQRLPLSHVPGNIPTAPS